MSEKVICHSGYTYAEKPVAINWQGHRLDVISIMAEWRTPHGRFFKVRTEDNLEFELNFHETPPSDTSGSIDDMWQIRQL